MISFKVPVLNKEDKRMLAEIGLEQFIKMKS